MLTLRRMQRIISLFVMMTLLFAMLPLPAVKADAPPFAGGTGTDNDPYQIETADQLDKVRYFLDDHFILMNDIDLDIAPYNTGEGWVPIGVGYNSGAPHLYDGFRGTFDGNGHTISNLMVNRPTAGDHQGLFASTQGHDSVIKNVGLINANVAGYSNVGILAGYNHQGLISNSYATGQVTGMYIVGGLVGYNSPGTIESSYASSNVTGDSSVGGLVGINNGTITNAYATDDVIGTNNVGGLVGLNYITVTNSYSIGRVQGGASSGGGLVGINQEGTITSSYYDLNKTERSDTGKGEGKSMVDMKIQAMYAGWDFDSIWAIDPAINNGYPYLQWEVQSDPVPGFGSDLAAQPGTLPSTTSLAGVEAGAGNRLVVQVSSSSIPAPNAGGEAPTGGVIIDPYEPGANILGVDAANNKYVGLYEVDEHNQVVKFSMVTLTRDDIRVFAGGDGSVDDPYQIANAEQLNEVRYYLNKHFVLVDDIDLNTAPYNQAPGWEPIGTYTPHNPFTGTFDGGGHEIRNIFITSGERFVGLFEYAVNAVIKNTSLVNVNIQSSTPNESYQLTGALAGSINNTTIENVHSSGEIKRRYDVGGLIGVASTNSIIINSSSSVNVLVPKDSEGNIELEYYNGNPLLINDDNKGGLIGSVGGPLDSRVTIRNSFATGQVEGVNQVGGLIGNGTRVDIEDSYATGDVIGYIIQNGGQNLKRPENIGGLVGRLMHATVKRSYSGKSIDGSKQQIVTGDSSTGGFVGSSQDSAYTNNYSRSAVDGYEAAGFIYSFSGSNTIEFGYFAGQVNQVESDWYGFAPGGSGVTVTGAVYYDNVLVPGAGDNEIGIGLPTDDMKNRDTFDNATNQWDFTSVWTIDPQGEINDGYPYFGVAIAPVIGRQPQDIIANAGDSVSLEVEASVTDGGTLAYQWYSNGIKSTAGGSAISGADEAMYAVPTDSTGTTYYYVVVTNTKNGSTATSNIVEVTVNALLPIPAADFIPAPTAQPGAQAGTTKLTGVSAGPGNRLMVEVTSAGTQRPNLGGAVSREANNYTIGSDISGVDATTNKYIALYEVDGAGNIVKFSEVMLMDSNIQSGSSNGDNGGGGSGNGSGGSEPDGGTSPSAGNAGDDAVIVLVNGKEENAGIATASERNGQTVTTIAVDQKKLDDKLAAEGRGAVVTIPVSTKSDVVIGELNGQMVKNMEGKEAVLVIRTGRATYTIPASQMNIDAVSKQVGQSVALSDIKVQIEISAPLDETVQIVENAAEKGSFTLVVPPVEFTIRATYGDTTIEVAKFNAYVERTVVIPEGVDPNKITTGVVVEPDGTVRHVPTRITIIDGIYYAVINSLTNSTYSVVWHPLEFSDMAKHWAKDAVNDMGSRMVVEGTGNGMFSPDRDITRAEFAAILVRGLGLRLEKGATAFSDVKATDWYNGAIHTAYAYRLIDGFTDGTFRPNDKITREQAMSILSKAMLLTGLKDKLPAKSAEAALQSFGDAASVAAWAQIGVADSVQAGIVTGRDENMLAPKANMTRAEVAQVIRLLLQKSGLI